MKQIDEPLHITVDYIPNDYFEDGDDWELYISINEDCAGPHNLIPFGKRLRNLTVNDIAKSIKEAIDEELFDDDGKPYGQYDNISSVFARIRRDAVLEALTKAIAAIEEHTYKEGLSAGMIWKDIAVEAIKSIMNDFTEDKQ